MAVILVRYGDKYKDMAISGSILPLWENMLNGDVGSRVKGGAYKTRTVQTYGTFGTGGSITLRGSNKENPIETTPADWFPLNSAPGSALTMTVAGGANVLEDPLWLSPIVTAGDGTTLLNAAVFGVKR